MKKELKGNKNRPRLRVFRSNKHIYAQVINDIEQKTIAASSSLSRQLRDQIISAKTCKSAKIVGRDIGLKLKDKGIEKIIFDRGNKIYHGRIQALAEAARQTGIQF